MTIGNKIYTTEEFEQFAAEPANRDRRLELINGEIVEKVPTEKHAVIAAKFTIKVGNFVEENDLGRIAVEPRHQMPIDQHNARLPDVAFTSKARALPLVEKGSVPQMPDLAIEIKSPDDDHEEMRQKAEYYLKNGSRMVWLVFDEKDGMEVCTLGADGKMQIQKLGIDDILDGGDVLPGFRMPIKTFFNVG